MATTYASLDDYRAQWAADPLAHTGRVIAVAVNRAESGDTTDTPGSAALSAVLGTDVARLASLDAEFGSGRGRFTRVVIAGPDGPPLAVLVIALLPASAFPGLGEDAVVREAAMVASANSLGQHLDSFIALSPGDEGESGSAVAAALAGHSYGSFQFKPEAEPELRLILSAATVTAETQLSRTVSDAESLADGIAWVRRLAETPGNLLTPELFAAEIVRRATPTLSAAVWSGDELVERGFGATIVVGGGSMHAPRVVELSAGDGDGPWIGIVGKGITYDSGGINIKQDLHEAAWMKSDMAAAAALAAAVIEAARRNPELRVRAIFPIAENMPGAGAGRPGDVVTHPGGETTEVTDTDCEGRLVIADGLSWLRRAGAAALIDAGTLTDSGGVGQAYWGTWSNDDSLVGDLIAAGAAAADPGWRLPLHPFYADTLESGVADIRNASLDQPDSGQIAATYLRHFVGDTPWAHLDIGAGAYLEHPHGQWRVGATGSPAAALTVYLSSRD